jgi:uncharacterized membrane protein
MPWIHAGPSILAAFLASLVEFVEALTVILAIGSVRGWMPAWTGAGAAVATLLLLVAALGGVLTAMPLQLLQTATGALLLLFGLRWLRKAILRSAGVIPLHDEAVAFAKERENFGRGVAPIGFDKVAFGAAFQITMLEGAEVVFIVVAIGAGGHGLLIPASLGALAALIAVALLGVVIHRPLAQVPENTLKFCVGVLLSAFGSFWFGEGIGVAWPGDDWSIAALIVGFLAAAVATIPLCRARRIARVAS